MGTWDKAGAYECEDHACDRCLRSARDLISVGPWKLCGGCYDREHGTASDSARGDGENNGGT